MTENSEAFLQDLFKNLDNKVVDGHKRLDDKLDILEGKLSEGMKDIHTVIGSRISDLEGQVIGHDKKITEHDHNFSVLHYAVNGGLAGIVGFITWFFGFFNHK